MIKYVPTQITIKGLKYEIRLSEKRLICLDNKKLSRDLDEYDIDYFKTLCKVY